MESSLRVICCAGLALLVVLLFNFVFARYRARLVMTESKEILESSLNFYRHTEPQATLEPHGVSQKRIITKKY